MSEGTAVGISWEAWIESEAYTVNIETQCHTLLAVAAEEWRGFLTRNHGKDLSVEELEAYILKQPELDSVIVYDKRTDHVVLVST